MIVSCCLLIYFIKLKILNILFKRYDKTYGYGCSIMVDQYGRREKLSSRLPSLPGGKSGGKLISSVLYFKYQGGRLPMT